MTKSEAISYLHKFIKKADAEQLRNLVCSTFSPRCSSQCPLRNGISCECKNIDMEDKKEE